MLRELDDARRSWPGAPRRPGSARWSPASPTATSPTWPRSWPPSTCCPAAGPCAGSGAAWWEREHRAYGWPFPSPSERFALLEDALQLLPLMWGPGAPAFEGREVTVPEAICYPRPLQDTDPDPRRRIGRAAHPAAGRPTMPTPATCSATPRRSAPSSTCWPRTAPKSAVPVADIRVTHLSTCSLPATRRRWPLRSSGSGPGRVSPEAWAARVNAATVEDHVGPVPGTGRSGRPDRDRQPGRPRPARAALPSTASPR